MGKAIYLEWTSESKALALFRKRLKRAEEKKGPAAVAGQTLDNLWDWVEMEEVQERRRFATVPMAKGYGRTYSKIDMYEQPRIFVTEWDDDPDDYQIVLALEYEGEGVWRNRDTGEVH